MVCLLPKSNRQLARMCSDDQSRAPLLLITTESHGTAQPSRRCSELKGERQRARLSASTARSSRSENQLRGATRGQRIFQGRRRAFALALTATETADSARPRQLLSRQLVPCNVAAEAELSQASAGVRIGCTAYAVGTSFFYGHAVTTTVKTLSPGQTCWPRRMPTSFPVLAQLPRRVPSPRLMGKQLKLV